MKSLRPVDVLGLTHIRWNNQTNTQIQLYTIFLSLSFPPPASTHTQHAQHSTAQHSTAHHVHIQRTQKALTPGKQWLQKTHVDCKLTSEGTVIPLGPTTVYEVPIIGTRILYSTYLANGLYTVTWNWFTKHNYSAKQQIMLEEWKILQTRKCIKALTVSPLRSPSHSRTYSHTHIKVCTHHIATQK